jgi:hypothetical protein
MHHMPPHATVYLTVHGEQDVQTWMQHDKDVYVLCYGVSLLIRTMLCPSFVDGR